MEAAVRFKLVDRVVLREGSCFRGVKFRARVGDRKSFFLFPKPWLSKHNEEGTNQDERSALTVQCLLFYQQIKTK